MRSIKVISFHTFAGTLLGLAGLFCAPAARTQSFTPTVRIVDKIDESNLVTLKGNTHPLAKAKYDTGRVSSSLPMSGLVLVLSRDAAQQAAFEKFVASQYDSSSPNFHHWLTPEQVGENFGPSETDITTISNWLAGHGFTVDEVSKNRLSIRFSGTAAQVESAFHTEIHNLEVKGVAHIANMSDPQIPAALGSTVVGVKALHNFFPRPLHHLGNTVTRDTATGKWKRSTTASSGATPAALKASGVRPQFGVNGTYEGTSYLVEDVAPYDFATIYNVLPLWNAGIDGTGETIAIAGTSSIKTSDVTTFRSTFGLPTTGTANTPKLQSGNSEALNVCTSTSSSALCTIDDQIENALDVEWSGSVAKNAQIVLVSSYPSSSSDDGLYDSESYIVNHISDSSSPVYGARIMNVSYGECELGNGTAGNVEYYNLWQTAASEGIAVFVASGDSGAAACDQGMDSEYGVPWPAEYGLSVSGLASTPYNTAVGGTDFNWCSLTATECTASPYWNSTNNSTTGASAIGYIPEVPWNDSCASSLSVDFLESYFSGYTYTMSGSATSVTDAETGCNAVVYYEQDIYQSDSELLDIVDTVGGGGGKSNCVVNDGTNVSSCITSTASTGSSYGSITLYEDGWPKPSWQSGVTGIPTDGVRDVPDVSFFASDGFLSSSAYLICVSDEAACTYSSKTEPSAQEVGGTSVATPAMAGVMALINQKAGTTQGNPNAELYTLAAAQTYGNCSAESVTTSSTCYFNDIDTGNNATPCDDGYYNNGTASPNCTVTHTGDADGIGILTGYSAGTGYDLATGLGSLNVYNVVEAWPASSTKTATYTLSASTASPSTVSPGSSATSTITLNGSNSYAGTVTLTCSVSPTTDTDTPTCSVSPTSVALSASTTTGTATVTVKTTAATTSEVRKPGKGWLGAGSGAVLALLLFFGIPAKRRGWQSMLGVLIVMAMLGSLDGCSSSSSSGSGSGSSSGGTTAGTYTITVNGTGNDSATTTASTSFTVVVN
jgi:subtilase family serine protease